MHAGGAYDGFVTPMHPQRGRQEFTRIYESKLIEQHSMRIDQD
jgi:hypothetical protein